MNQITEKNVSIVEWHNDEGNSLMFPLTEPNNPAYLQNRIKEFAKRQNKANNIPPLSKFMEIVESWENWHPDNGFPNILLLFETKNYSYELTYEGNDKLARRIYKLEKQLSKVNKEMKKLIKLQKKYGQIETRMDYLISIKHAIENHTQSLMEQLSAKE